MKAFFKNIVAVFLLSFAIVQQTNSQNFNPNLAALLQQTLDTQVAAFTDTKGVSASVYYPGQGIWKGASGYSYAGQPITTDMEFGLASNTKLFTAVAIMKLVESRKLTLNDQLNKWIPTFNNIDSSITIRQLLNHTSGIADVFTTASMAYIDTNPSHNFTTTEVMAYVGPKLFNKGTSYSYSNTNYILAGMIAESATGQHISKIIRDSILTPLQLDSTFFDGKETVLGTIAHPWQDGADKINISRNALNTLGTSAGAMYSTASEMAQWYQALMSGQVVNATSFNEITTFVGPNNYYGFGLTSTQLLGRTVWGHGGSIIGYKSRMFYDPEMKAIVCGLSNSNPSAIDGAITGILLKTLIDSLPAKAGIISGVTTVCQGQTSITYSVPSIAKATSYIWTLPNGASGVSATNSITVNYGGIAVSGDITVVGSNKYGNGTPSQLLITVNPTPIVTFSGSIGIPLSAKNTLCSDVLPFIITGGTPFGGTYSGKGVVNGMFNPSVSGIGDAVITYSYTNSNGCTNSDSFIIKIVAKPIVKFTAFSVTKYCMDSPPVPLAGGTPTGGFYSGKGVIDGVFDPNISGVGDFTISYFYKDSNNCSGIDSIRLTVVPKPMVTFDKSLISTFCKNTSPIMLNYGQPKGGSYSGKGVVSGMFDPSLIDSENVSIMYSYTDTNGCTNSDSGIIKINLPTSSIITITAADSFSLNEEVYSKSGTYTQTLKNSEGCDSIITLHLTITTTGISELPINTKSVLYPNPSSGKLSVTLDELYDNSTTTEFHIYNILGNKQFSIPLSNSITDIELNLSSGLYIYTITNKKSIILAGKLLIQ